MTGNSIYEYLLPDDHDEMTGILNVHQNVYPPGFQGDFEMFYLHCPLFFLQSIYLYYFSTGESAHRGL